MKRIITIQLVIMLVDLQEKGPWPQYEMKDHLGNVRVTYSDCKIYNGGVYPNVSSLTADVRSVSNYYPGGMLQPGRAFSSSDYRFGFNGFEKDDKIKGTGNHLSWRNFGPQ